MTLDHLDTLISYVVIITGVSLVVMIMTQTMSMLLGLRGTNLRWGIQTLLMELEPSLAAHAATISEKVLHHPLISDSTVSRLDFWLVKRWKLASVVRKDELIDVLHLLAQQPSDESAGKKEDWRTALSKALENLDQAPAENLVLAAPEIRKLFPNDPAKAEQVITQMMASAEHLTGSINQWFDSMMDRVSQRFVSYARAWTIVFSLLVAFALHLDTFNLLTRLSANADMRASLVASADTLNKKADEILATTPNSSPTVYVLAMKQLISSHPNELKQIQAPSGFSTSADGKQWLLTQLTAAKIEDTAKWAGEFEALVPQAALRTAADDFHSILDDNLKFQLIPDPYPKPFYNYWTPSWMHLWGILASALMLSLGAPFWFNILKTLSNLRPVLANKEQQETASESQK
jgi:hypothetical protein